MKQKRLFYLDVIRAVCAVMIVVYHFPLAISQPVDYFHSFANGSFGMIAVYCFFMVSGASLMYRYQEETKLDLKAFYKKRFFSIYPLFWITYVMAFFWVFWQLGEVYRIIPTKAIIWSVIGMDGWLAHLVPTFYMVGEWFLGSIIILYAVFPLLRVWYKKNRHMLLAASLLAALWLFAANPFPMEIKQNPITGVFYFLLGAWLEDERQFFSARNPKGLNKVWLCAACGMIVWIFVPVTGGVGQFGREVSFLLFSIIFYLFWMGASGWLEGIRVLKNGISRLAAASYGVFLTHHVAAQMITGHFAAAESSTREIFTMLLMTFALTWVWTIGIYKIEAYIKSFF